MRDRFFFLFILFGLLFTSQAFALSDTNLTAWYKLDETTGLIAIDSKGYDNNGITKASYVTLNQPGKIGTSYYFNGNGDISGGDVKATLYTITNTKISVALWVYPYITAQGTGFSFRREGGSGGWNVFNPCLVGGNKLVSTVSNTSSHLNYGYSPVDINVWTHYVFTYEDNNRIVTYKNGVLIDSNIISYIAPNLKKSIAIGTNYDGVGVGSDLQWYNGRIDEVSVWNRVLSQSDVTELYNSGNGISYPFDGISVDFNYIIRKDLNKILLRDTSIATNVSKTAWTWKANGTTISTAQDYNYTATELTDYNICLHVDTNVSDVNGDKCYSFNTGDWTPPTTTFTSSQVPNTTINTLRFICTDNNSGCKYLNYNIDSNVWIQVANTGTKDINYSGAGSHSIQYFSTDNSDNNETIKTSTFTTYGTGHFTFKDENTNTTLTGVTVSDGTNTWVLSGNTWDANFQNYSTSTNVTFSFTKTNYGTRHYQVDLNNFTDFNKTILLLPTSLGQDVPLTVFSPTLALLPNTYVEFYKPDKNNGVVERLLTNSEGKTTINISKTDTNYWATINQGTYTYKPVLLTINIPKNELTGLDLNAITNPFNVTITGPNYATYSNRTTAVTAYLLTNTTNPYIIQISDANNNYFPRNFQIIFQGNPLSYTLTPYLLSYVNGISVKVATYQQNSMLVTVYPNVRYDIFKSTGYGNILLETKITDAKGEALSILNPGDTYTFNVYTLDSNNNTTAIQFNGSTDIPIKTTGSTVALIITKTSVTQVDENIYGYQPKFGDSNMVYKSNGIGDVNFNILNPGQKYYELTYYFDYNGTPISTPITTPLYINDLNKAFDANFDWSKIPQDTKFLNLQLILLDFDSQQVSYYTKTFTIVPSTAIDIVNMFRNGVRNEIFGCTLGKQCYPSAVAWFLFSIILMIIVFVKQGYGLVVNPFSFVILMALGTFLNWVPAEITMVIALGAIGLKLVDRS